MGLLEDRIKYIASDSGAALVGIASRQRLADAPPSADPGYLLSSTQSVISFATAYDQKALGDFFRKKNWRAYNVEKKKHTQYLYEIGDHVSAFLKGEGFDVLAVDINNNYRPEPGVQDASEMVAMLPDFSHRYAAVAAGLGRLGWSGNVMTPQYGSAVLLGTVLTSARLRPDPVLADHPCDRCKMCVASCPVEMIHQQQSVKIHIAGMTEEIARKRTNNCCWIGCDGYHGLSPNKKWTNWSPYRVAEPLSADDRVVDELCTRLRKADPDASPDDLNIYTDYRQSYFDPQYLFFSVCGHCANVCWANRNDRVENRKLLVNSGTVVLQANGERCAVYDDKDLVEMDTPFHLKVAVLRKDFEAAVRGDMDIDADKAVTLKDKMVLESMKQLSRTAGDDRGAAS